MKTRLLRIACGLLLTLALTGCAGADAIVLPDAAEVTAVRVTAGGAVTLHRDPAWIQSFLTEAAEAAPTGRESVQTLRASQALSGSSWAREIPPAGASSMSIRRRTAAVWSSPMRASTRGKRPSGHSWRLAPRRPQSRTRTSGRR